MEVSLEVGALGYLDYLRVKTRSNSIHFSVFKDWNTPQAKSLLLKLSEGSESVGSNPTDSFSSFPFLHGGKNTAGGNFCADFEWQRVANLSSDVIKETSSRRSNVPSPTSAPVEGGGREGHGHMGAKLGALC